MGMKLPDHCQICKDPIHLYQPYYTLKIQKHIGGIFANSGMTVLCPSCFHAYENFITEQTVHENHKRTMNDIKHN